MIMEYCKKKTLRDKTISATIRSKLKMKKMTKSGLSTNLDSMISYISKKYQVTPKTFSEISETLKTNTSFITETHKLSFSISWRILRNSRNGFAVSSYKSSKTSNKYGAVNSLTLFSVVFTVSSATNSTWNVPFLMFFQVAWRTKIQNYLIWGISTASSKDLKTLTSSAISKNSKNDLQKSIWFKLS